MWPPPQALPLQRRLPEDKPSRPNSLVLEAWAQGYMVGSLIIMAAITVANMRRGVLLHKLILLELVMGMFHGTFIFANPPAYGWYLSATAIPLNMSWSLHNVVAWMKTKPFLSRRWSLFYIITVILVQPYWVLEIYANFVYFNSINLRLFRHTRPYEALFRDPWWIFTAINLLYNISNRYNMSLITIIRTSPRFGVLLIALLLSICFIVVDICAVTGVFDTILPDGLNPFWKLAFVFKCLTDSIVLDDFKTALDRLMRHKLHREAIGSDSWNIIQSTQDNTRGSRFHDHDYDEDAAAALGRPESVEQAQPGQQSDLWRVASLATGVEEDPLGDESVDRARNRAAARARAMRSRLATPMRPRSLNDIEDLEAARRPTSEERQEWQRKEWHKIAPMLPEPCAQSDSSSSSRDNNRTSPHRRPLVHAETWDAVDLPPWPTVMTRKQHEEPKG